MQAWWPWKQKIKILHAANSMCTSFRNKKFSLQPDPSVLETAASTTMVFYYVNRHCLNVQGIACSGADRMNHHARVCTKTRKLLKIESAGSTVCCKAVFPSCFDISVKRNVWKGSLKVCSQSFMGGGEICSEELWHACNWCYTQTTQYIMTYDLEKLSLLQFTLCFFFSRMRSSLWFMASSYGNLLQ